MPFTYEYPRPALTADILMIGIEQECPYVLLIKRKKPPFQSMWALPGGFVQQGESLEQTARRELQEETGLYLPALVQWKTYSDPQRDPRGWIVSTLFVGYCLVNTKKPEANDDAADAQWWCIEQLPPLAFDHQQMIEEVCHELQQLDAACVERLLPALMPFWQWLSKK